MIVDDYHFFMSEAIEGFVLFHNTIPVNPSKISHDVVGYTQANPLPASMPYDQFFQIISRSYIFLPHTFSRDAIDYLVKYIDYCFETLDEFFASL